MSFLPLCLARRAAAHSCTAGSASTGSRRVGSTDTTDMDSTTSLPPERIENSPPGRVCEVAPTVRCPEFRKWRAYWYVWKPTTSDCSKDFMMSDAEGRERNICKHRNSEPAGYVKRAAQTNGAYLRSREGDVQVEHDGQRRAAVGAEHARQHHEVVVVDPDHVLRVQAVLDGVAEELVHAQIRVEPLRVHSGVVPKGYAVF